MALEISDVNNDEHAAEEVNDQEVKSSYVSWHQSK